MDSVQEVHFCALGGPPGAWPQEAFGNNLKRCGGQAGP